MAKMSYARERNVTFTISNETWLEKQLSVDISQELITIIGNLVDNAIEALSSSNEKKLDLQLKESDGKIMISISDSGPGIAKENLEIVFERGYSTKGPNRGFGLYLLKQSIEKLNGSFQVSTSEQGTVFEVVVDYVSMKDGIKYDD